MPGSSDASALTPNSGMSRLETVAISRAAADQRRGRAGRTAPGVCYRLWSESAHAALAAQAPAEIIEADLAPLALDLACWGCTDPAESRLARSAARGDARAGARTAATLRCRSMCRVRVTAIGRRMAQLATHPRLAHMIVRAEPLGLRALACEIAALLSERDPLRTPPGQRDPDLRHRIDVLHGMPRATGLHRGRACFAAGATIAAGAGATSSKTRQRTRAPPEVIVPSDEAVGLLLAFAYPDRIGLARGGGEAGRYLLSNGRGGVLPGPSALARSEVIVAADIDAGEREAKLYLAAPLGRALLERASRLPDRGAERDRLGRTHRNRRGAPRATPRRADPGRPATARCGGRAHDRRDAAGHPCASACAACRGLRSSNNGVSACRCCARRSTMRRRLSEWPDVTRRGASGHARGLARAVARRHHAPRSARAAGPARGAARTARLESAAAARRTCPDAPCRTEWLAHRRRLFVAARPRWPCGCRRFSVGWTRHASRVARCR